MIRVKICGLRDAAAARAALAYGADYLGFVFADGKRRVAPEQVSAILTELPSPVKAVGVFMNQTPAEVARIVQVSGVSHIQLHGEERIVDYLFLGLPIIKAVPVSPEGNVVEADLAGSAYGLLDTRLPHQTGGTGTPFDWETAARQMPTAPCFVAGGLNPDNVREAVRMLSPFGVDVSSGVEMAGVKKPELIRRFIEEVRRKP